MKEIKWTDLVHSRASELLAGPCLKVMVDGDMAFYLVIRPEALMRDKVEGLCGLIDAGRGVKA